MDRLLYTLLGCALLLCSCAEQYVVTGTSSQAVLDGRMAYMKEMEGDTFAKMDSCEVLHGNFRMSGPLDSVRCVWLFMGDNLNSPPIPIVLEKGDVRVNISSSVKIEGTPLNDRLYVFLTSVDSLKMLGAELPKLEGDMYLEGYPEDEINIRLAGEAQMLREALDRLETTFIKSNFDNVLGVTWFLQLCNMAQQFYGYPTTTPQIDEIYGSAPDAFRKNRMVEEYMRRCNER